MSLANFTERVKSIVDKNKSIDAKVKFVLSEGVVFVDGTKQPGEVNNQDLPSDCSIKLSLDNANKLLDGNLNVMTALMMGKVKIEGDMGVAMKVAKIIAS